MRVDSTFMERFQARADELGLKVTHLVGYLIRNDSIAPATLVLRSTVRAGKQSRVPLPLALPSNLRRFARGRAKTLGGTFTSYVEALAERDMAAGGAFVILPDPNL